MPENQHMPETALQSLYEAQDTATKLPDDVSPNFIKSDQFTALHEGGITKNDSLGGAAAFGIDQNAHPNIDVSKITPERAQAMRYEYWRSIGGDELTKKSPALAEEAYDTAIMSGPEQAQKFLKEAQDDPNKFFKAREQFFHNLERRPQYHNASIGWENRNRDLAKEVLSDKKISKNGKTYKNEVVSTLINRRLRKKFT